ncbi:MAG: hypothetical protein Q8Q09_04455 [Deltaproteobacteria bacterium]|nr:hypothetical protein [Deltaproteobacteria bacterium]
MSWVVRGQQSKDMELLFVFRGKLTSEEGAQSAKAVTDALTIAPRRICWDLRSMDGYDSDARKAWQSAIVPLRHRITAIRVVGGTKLARMGAAALGLALGVNVSFEEIDEIRRAA